MISVRKVNPSIFPQILPLLVLTNDRYLQENDWRRVVDYSWQRTEDYCGYGLFDGDDLVGYNGCIFSQRVINGERQSICNLTTWAVREDYRSHSLSLMLPILHLKAHTLTDLSASPQAFRVLQRFGFQELDQNLIVLLPIFPLITGFQGGRVKAIRDHEGIYEQLKGENLRLFQDHLHIPDCHHFLFLNPEGSCYIIYSLVRNNTRRPYCYLHHISDIDLFYRWNRLIRTELARTSHTIFILVDSRVIRDRPLPFSYEIPLVVPRLYKSSDLHPKQIDNLYSELILLNFSTIPGPVPEYKALGKICREILFGWRKTSRKADS
jgi:hypothetical protein